MPLTVNNKSKWNQLAYASTLNRLRNLKWWQILGQFLVFCSMAGLVIGGIGAILGFGEEFTGISLLVFMSCLGSFLLLILIFMPLTTKSPFIPDDVDDPRIRREEFEWNLLMYGFLILFCGVCWLFVLEFGFNIEGAFGGLIFFFILWVASALVMCLPSVRMRIDQYYEKNTCVRG